MGSLLLKRMPKKMPLLPKKPLRKISLPKKMLPLKKIHLFQAALVPQASLHPSLLVPWILSLLDLLDPSVPVPLVLSVLVPLLIHSLQALLTIHSVLPLDHSLLVPLMTHSVELKKTTVLVQLVILLVDQMITAMVASLMVVNSIEPE